MTTRDPIGDQVRRTLHTVAGTIPDDAHPAPLPTAEPGRPTSRRRRWRLAGLVGGVVLIPATAAAAAIVHQGPEYVTTIPQSRVIVQGELDGDEYLLVRERATNCEHVGAELVVEKRNILGSEWSTTVANYGQAGRRDSCFTPTRRYLADPSLYQDGGQAVGDSFVWVWAVHPDVTGVRITTDDVVEELPVYPVDGAGYALYEVPSDGASYTAELLIGDQVVPGSQEEHTQ